MPEESEQSSQFIPVKSLAIVKELEAPPTQATLHHYTRRNGLIGLLSPSKELWASNARYLNDAQELSTAQSVMREMLRLQSYAAGSPEDALRIDIEQSFDFFRVGMDAFVFSFSENDDLLSQWRAYDRAGDAYTVGCSTALLVALAGDADGYLTRCHYEPSQQRALLHVVISDAFGKLSSALGSGGEPLKARAQALAVFVAGFQLAAPMIKHRKFEEEREWRLIFPFFNVNPRVRYRDDGRLLVPYLPVPFGQYDNFITHVGVGPTPHEALELRAMSGLLATAGFGKASVSSSEVPFRDW